MHAKFCGGSRKLTLAEGIVVLGGIVDTFCGFKKAGKKRRKTRERNNLNEGRSDGTFGGGFFRAFFRKGQQRTRGKTGANDTIGSSRTYRS